MKMWKHETYLKNEKKWKLFNKEKYNTSLLLGSIFSLF